MLGRLVHKSDFERLMQAPVWSRSAHFALHHLPKAPPAPAAREGAARTGEISTDLDNVVQDGVDKLPDRVWFGVMVPKRHARRAVTRNLLKRQIRQAFGRHHEALPPGLWLVRLRGMFAQADFPSARSEALAESARRELDGLLTRGPATQAGGLAGAAARARRRRSAVSAHSAMAADRR